MRTSHLIYCTAAVLLVPAARAQVAPNLVLISQEAVDTVDDRIQAWLSPDIDLGLETDNETVIGVFLGSGQELVEFYLSQVIKGINAPLKNAKILLEIISFPHAGLTDKIRDVLDLFVYRVADDAIFYPNFVRRLVSIAWNFLVKLYNLLPVTQLDVTDKFSSIADGLLDLFNLDGLLHNFNMEDLYDKFNKKQLPT